ncbi:MAG: isoleucine--tRNA ligase [Candidatus Micrarchaeaceae archaeon]
MFDANKIEEEIQSYWEKHEIIRKVREKNRNGKPFYFLDGPPYVSGDLHPGQLWVKASKDAYIRYKRYRGFDLYDRAGYDVHGLPIEHKVELQLGVKSKQEIESSIGLEKFVESCKSFVRSYIGRMDSDYRRFGVSLDFSNPYLPLENSYMETAWGILKNVSDKGYLYKAIKPTLYCPKCETTLAQGTMEVVYGDETDPSIFVAFKVDPKSKSRIKLSGEEHLVIWTTTPWTLPANMAVAANPKALYVKARLGGMLLILAKERLDMLVSALNESAVVEEEFYGSELEGLHYINPLESIVPMQKKFSKYHKVIMSEALVNVNEGTGFVHLAPGHGAEDYLEGKKNKIPIFSPVDKKAMYTDEAGAYKGLRIPDEANKKVLEDLEKLGALLSNGEVSHSYPHCWRCGSKLVYISTEQWFINIQRIKEKIIRASSRVSWHPSEAMKWQEDVLRSSPDWVISRQRYWGIPLPIWRCGGCGNTTVIGSFSELKSKALDPGLVDSMKDFHRPYIDAVKLRCERCGSEMHRIPDIFDVWFDSSIAFRASLSDEMFEKLFPVDFILEGLDQLRGWFSAQLKIGTLIYGKSPFKNVIVDGMFLAEDGREMHKSLGNYISVEELLKMTSADAFRLWTISHLHWLDLTFSKAGLENAKRTIEIIYNISNLLEEYSKAFSYTNIKTTAPPMGRLDNEDVWIISRLNSVAKEVTESFDTYRMFNAANILTNFVVEDLSRFYLKIAKEKMKRGKAAARRELRIIDYVFSNLLILFSPIIPFATEYAYLKRYAAKESIFLNDWPRYKERLISKETEEAFDVVKASITALLSSREKAGIKLRQPLKSATIEVKESYASSVLMKNAELIESYANVMSLAVKEVHGLVKEVKPVFARIGPDFKADSGVVAEALKSVDADELQKAVAKDGYYILHTENGEFTIRQDHFTIVTKAEKADAVEFKYGLAYVDTEIPAELKEQAFVREFERHVQLLRKKSMLSKPDKIILYYYAAKEAAEIINRNAAAIKSDLNAKQVRNTLPKGIAVSEFEIEGIKFRVAIEKISGEE